MRGVARLCGAKTVSLYGLGEDDGWSAFVLNGSKVGVIDLLWIMTAAVQILELLIGHVGNKFEQLGISAEELFAHVSAALGLKALVLAVDGLFHALKQQPRMIACKQRVPIAAPYDLDYIPTCASECAFELIDNLSVPAHWPIQALEVAVHDEDQVVELLTRCHR